MSERPKIKRRKKINTNPNPLFIQWLTEWRDEAATKGWKTQYAFGKALGSLKKYPMRLQSGKSCMILEHFGDKICKMLDKKLEVHIAENGPIDNTPIEEEPRGDSIQPQKSNSSKPKTSAIEISDSEPDDTSGDTQEVREAENKKKKKRVPSRSPREYVPQYRSGPYAIILTLQKNHTMAGSLGYMGKTELQQEAQNLCDKSFVQPDPGCHYTAWSSMSTLISKGLVAKDGNPARFSITEKGITLAHKLERVTAQREAANNSMDHGPGPGITSPPNDMPDLPSLSPPEDRIPAQMRTNFNDHSDGKEEEFYFQYIDDAGREVSSKDSAMVIIDEEISIGFLIKCKQTALDKSCLRYKIDISRNPTGGFIYAYLANSDALEVCNPPPSIPASFPSFSSNLNTHSSTTTNKTMSYAPPPATGFTNSQSSIAPSSASSDIGDDSSGRDTLEGGHPEPPKPLYTLTPGNFEIVLCVDNCETSGGAKQTRKNQLLPELQKNGVCINVRKLQVGDFLWVAREKSLPIAGQLKMPERKEAVLDYVVERKRMDDLCSSMTDGRFREQKFRLKQCGLRKPIYLVEDFGSSEHLSIPLQTLQQATVNTQVTDGFFVKNTKDMKESVAYLTIMTRFLQSQYERKTIEAYKRDDLEKIVQADPMTSLRLQLMTFNEFNERAVKNKDSTINEIFAKQLLQISGLSADKALGIITMYKTPADLLDTYDSCALQKDKEKLLARLKYGKLERNLGPSLSKQIYQLYCTEGSLT